MNPTVKAIQFASRCRTHAVYIHCMKSRVECMVAVRTQLIGLRHASAGVLATERQAMQWGWLERILPAAHVPIGFAGAWNVPLPSQRMAVCRIAAPTDQQPAPWWSVCVLVLEVDQYAWLAKRLQGALADEVFWHPSNMAAAEGVVMPSWPEDAKATSAQRSACLNLAQSGAIRPPGVSRLATAHACDQQVLQVLALVAESQLPKLRWSIGLPEAAPKAMVASVRPLGQGLHAAPRAMPAVRPEAVMPPPVPVAAPGNGWQVAVADPAPVFASPAPAADAWDIALKRRSRVAWVVPTACSTLMAASIASAVWVLLRARA
jgi:hypothetical protein